MTPPWFEGMVRNQGLTCIPGRSCRFCIKQYGWHKCYKHEAGKKVCRKSDEAIVAEKHVNKHVEQRAKTHLRFLRGNIRQYWRLKESMGTELKEVRELSQKYPRLETLINRVNKESLRAVHQKQMAGKATGIDGVTKSEYDQNLEENLDGLLKRMKSFSYHPQPVRRTYIPKVNGKKRPLGIPSYEDRLVQGVMANILKDIYEPRFLECSYGFREGKSVHDAIRDINQIIMIRKVNYILDCDIKGFFDNVNHEWMMRFLEHDIADRNFLRYIARFLKAGVMENGNVTESSVGTPQGGLISPVLANVYLHYVLDLWFEKAIKPRLKGEAYLIRFADDFIIMFQYENEAQAVYEVLEKRLHKFGLEMEKEKTHILPFGRYKGTKETFDFLGFTHYNSETQTGKYMVGHKVSKKKRKMFKANLTKWVKEHRTMNIAVFMTKLEKKLTGSLRFYAISGTFACIKQMHQFAKQMAYKWLNRRSQRRSFRFEKFQEVWKQYVPEPKIYVNIWGWKCV